MKEWKRAGSQYIIGSQIGSTIRLDSFIPEPRGMHLAQGRMLG